MERSTFLNLKKKVVNHLFLLLVFSAYPLMTAFSNVPEYAIGEELPAYTDTDGDGVPDYMDIDDDGDGIIDTVEDSNADGDKKCHTNPSDQDGDGIPDYLDIDSDNDGIIDNVEAQSEDGYISPSCEDKNHNGLDDAYEMPYGNCGGLVPVDTDGDNVPDYKDVDSDNDGIIDNIEAQTTVGYIALSGKDHNGNGLDDAYEELGDNVCNYNSKESHYNGTDKVELCHKEDKSIHNPRNGYHTISVAPSAVQAHLDHGDTLGACEKTCSFTGGLEPIDTDGDGFADYRDIDSDDDGIIDNVEAQNVDDYIAPCGVDSDGNGLDDHYEDYPGSCGGITPINTDNDPLPNFRDIDSDDDGIPDNVEGQATAGYIPPTGNDDDNDGLDNAYEGSGDEGITPEDTDSDSTPDYLDDDTDNDLVFDNNEGNDFNFDGIPDWTYMGTDTDNDGLDDGYEGSDVNDGYDVNDEIENPATDLPDTDGTEDVNYRDFDDDGDGIDTPDEDADDNGDPTNDDTDEDGTPDYLDPVDNKDTDGDGVTDDDEEDDGTDPNDPCDFVLGSQSVDPSSTWNGSDCDGDGVTNEDEVTDGTDPLDPCDYDPEHITLPQSGDYLDADCDGDGVTNGKEDEDGTDPNDPCDFVLGSQTVETSSTWNTSDCDGDGVTNEDEVTDGTDLLDPCDYNPDHVTLPQSGDYLEADCDGDGVTNEDEVTDGTDPLDPCDYNPDHVTLPQSGDYLEADCDGDGVTNEDEIDDGTDPNDSCDFVLGSQTVDPSSTWNGEDCDGDGVTNGDETEDGTDPLDPCDYNPDSVTLTPSVDWEALDCDDDGNPNGTDPNPLAATAMDDSGSTPALTEVAINILENDDYLPNNDENNIGITSLTRTGGDAAGSVAFDADTGIMSYTPIESESNSTVTVVYEVCNVIPDPAVCASATVTIQIGPNAIDALDDQYAMGGTDGGTVADSNVLSNDTLNGESVTLEEVLLTSTDTNELTINVDGSVSVAPDTPAGIYTIDYTICEIANVDNCDTATVTVEVTADMVNVIDAVEDSYSTDGNSGEIADSNVLSNDTLNGESVTLENVLLTSTATNELTINEDGSVSIMPGTTEGTYTIDYTICEIANVDNCDTATVTVEVGPGMVNVIEAMDDGYTSDGTGGPISGSDVLENDTLNGESISLIDVILTSTSTGDLTVNEDGSITVAPDLEEGEYTIEYTICEAANPDNCDTAIVTVVIEDIAVNQLVTPNGDLKNDFLFIRGVDKIKSSTLKIFNRWGTAVYEGKDYNNVNNVFDGRSRAKSAIGNDKYLPAGVYFYIFEYVTERGSFTDSEYIYISR